MFKLLFGFSPLALICLLSRLPARVVRVARAWVVVMLSLAWVVVMLSLAWVGLPLEEAWVDLLGEVWGVVPEGRLYQRHHWSQ